MRCPTCGKAELEQKEGDKEFKGVIVKMQWRECPECGEKLYSAKQIKRAEQVARRSS